MQLMSLIGRLPLIHHEWKEVHGYDWEISSVFMNEFTAVVVSTMCLYVWTQYKVFYLINLLKRNFI